MLTCDEFVYFLAEVELVVLSLFEKIAHFLLLWKINKTYIKIIKYLRNFIHKVSWLPFCFPIYL